MKAVLAIMAITAHVATALDNGLALTPPMALSTWNLASSDVTIADVKTQTAALIATGLASKGYGSFHVDEGWLLGRNSSSGEIVTDLTKFPDGMDGTGAWVHSQTYTPSPAAVRRARAVAEFHGLHLTDEDLQAERNFTYWLYTSRGTVQCGTSQYHAPGSQGHEKADAAWMAAAGADGAKIDSCGGVQVPAEAIADYALWRDSFNATGKDMVFSLCGWKPLYSPVGSSLGNLWRISGDGRSWGPLTLAMDRNAYLGQNAGPGGWNDPDLLQGDGTGCHGPDRTSWYQSNNQSRAQMSLWSVMAAPLIISASVADSNAFLLETWGNEEVIDVNQDPMGVQGGRIVGRDSSDPGNDEAFSGTNVWARPLVDGSWALVLLNNDAATTTVSCGPECLARLRFNTSAMPSPAAMRAFAVAAMTQTGEGSWGNAVGDPGNVGSGFSNAPADGIQALYFSPCKQPSDDSQAFAALPQSGGAMRLVHKATGKCATVFNCSGADATSVGLEECVPGAGAAGACGASAQLWQYGGSVGVSPGRLQSLVSSSSSVCLDQYHFNTSFADAYACNGGENQAFSIDNSTTGHVWAQQSGQCLTAAPGPQTGLTLRVRDLWAHADVGTIDPSKDTISATLAGNGSVAMYRLWVQ